MKARGKFIAVPAPGGGHVGRPNKLAAGMTATLYRSRHKLDGDALTLSVKGSLDALASRGFVIAISKVVSGGICRCCGQKTRKHVISDYGRRKLARLRRR